MKSFQLTSNGKIDKKALPEPNLNELFTDQYVAPRTEVEKKLVSIWQELFHIQKLGIQDDFFDLGGTSIMAIQVVSRTRRAGYHLQPSDFFSHQNIEELSRLINERLQAGKAKGLDNSADVNGTVKSIVIVNSKGTKVPFFFMSPGFSVFDRVINYLDEDQPSYFFVPLPYKRVEDIAAYYIQEMKKIQPEGPYCLGAYCDFGEVALEMAQQLTAKGEQVSFLALFDFYHPSAMRTLNNPVDYYKERLKHYYKELNSVSLKQKASLLYQFIHRKFRKVKARTSKAIDVKLKKLPQIKGYLIGKKLYTAKPYNGRVLLFRTTIRTAKRMDDLIWVGTTIS